MNKKLMLITVIIFTLVAIGIAEVQPVQPVQQNRQGYRMHTFDVTSTVTIEGKILEVTQCTSGKGKYSAGVLLTIADAKQGKNTQVYLGPNAFIQSNNWELKKGESIAIKAYIGTGNDNGNFFASQLSQGGKQLELRDKTGRPLWRRSAIHQGYRQGNGARRNCLRNL